MPATRAPRIQSTSRKDAARDLQPIAAAAAYASCSTKTIRRRIADGTLTAYRFGPRIIRVDLAELERLLRPVGGAV